MDLDLSTAIPALHVVVGTVFVGLGVQNYVAGRPEGLVLLGLLGLCFAGLGVGVSRLVASR